MYSMVFILKKKNSTSWDNFVVDKSKYSWIRRGITLFCYVCFLILIKRTYYMYYILCCLLSLLVGTNLLIFVVCMVSNYTLLTHSIMVSVVSI